ncbi:hypothetical protein CBR59_31140 [Bacillus thuringiensis]|uniref:FtsX-like permease family protein n=1 Tax=Bacillus thuringiensis TaxID=1428 RepID=UPI000C9E7EC5|nr:ABC transporter permease [Bacillus thuringiensis]PNK22331.1 hypothetical protein CBP87_31745 [Bacillus thuringiensis]PNK45090.1 hypothetical protein CBR59_31140 [Bacillus thuringiensis]
MTGYLLYRYFSHQKVYKKLPTSPETLHESIEELYSTPLSISIKNLLKTQYHYYQSQIKLWERKREEQVIFMNQWVHQIKTPLSVIRIIIQDAYDERFESKAEEADQMRQGMSYRQLNKLILIENILIAFLSIIVGIEIGLAFSKLILLISASILSLKDGIPFYFSIKASTITSAAFIILFVLISIVTSGLVKVNLSVGTIKIGRKAQTIS